jgi:signal transduction histidine kinase
VSWHRERILDHVFRVDEARSRDRGGTGLGLAIAKWAGEIYGGRIAVEPRPERGSLFRIVLPLASATVGSEQQAISQGVGGSS